jgi:two-component system chemotaxis response regulator CheB
MNFAHRSISDDMSPRGGEASSLGRKNYAPSVLLIGASTGGPQALSLLMTRLTSVAPHLPICVTLHLPVDLMPILAAHVQRTSGIEARVVQTTEDLRPGMIYFAPGDRHLHFHRRKAGCIDLCLKPSPAGGLCKPAVDVMLASAAACFGMRTLAVILSGMGEDGLDGARAVTAAGGSVLVQDKASSAVWGMPGAIVKADLAAGVFGPTALGDEIVMRMRRTGAVP